MTERLKVYGLTAPITHFAYDRIKDDPKGTLDFHRVLGADYIGLGIMPLDIIQNITGFKYGFIEQDNCNGQDPFECMKCSYAYFRAKGFY